MESCCTRFAPQVGHGIGGVSTRAKRGISYRLGSPNGRFLRHRFLPKPTNVATPISLPKRIHVAKEAVSAARQTKTRQWSERCCKPNDAPRTKPRPCVKPMLWDAVTCGKGRHLVDMQADGAYDSAVIRHWIKHLDSDWATIFVKVEVQGRPGVVIAKKLVQSHGLGSCLLYTSPSPRDLSTSRMPSSA